MHLLLSALGLVAVVAVAQVLSPSDDDPERQWKAFLDAHVELHA